MGVSGPPLGLHTVLQAWGPKDILGSTEQLYRRHPQAARVFPDDQSLTFSAPSHHLEYDLGTTQPSGKVSRQVKVTDMGGGRGKITSAGNKLTLLFEL